MGAASSVEGGSNPPFTSIEEALAAGRTQEEVDTYLVEHPEHTPATATAANADAPPQNSTKSSVAQGNDGDTDTGLTLVYLKMQALAEPAQLMLHYAAIPYNYEYAFNYWSRPWPQCKSIVPFGQVPVLIVNGDENNMIAQSGAICRYIASLKPDLFKPEDLTQCARCDAIFDTAQELFMGTNPVANFFTGEKFAGAVTKFMEAWPGKLDQYTKQLDMSEGPFFFGAKPMYCDFAVYHHFMTIRLLKADALDSAPSVVAFMDAFEGLAGVSEYLANRPNLVGVGENPRLRFPDGREMPCGGAPDDVSTALSKVKSAV